jgi:hypothetical protein
MARDKRGTAAVARDKRGTAAAREGCIELEKGVAS